MPVTIIEPNSAPMRRVDVDPITLDIIENAIRNAREEMDVTLFRTAMSPGIREQHDAFPMIANLHGQMVVGQFGSFLHGFKEAYDGTLEEGDIIFTNDPYSCNGAVSHCNDWLLIKPIFKDGRMIAWGCHFGHMTDIGGKVPGSLPTDAKQIFEEGIMLPPTKIYKKGVLDQEILNILLRNSRTPDWNKSDVMGVIAACNVADRRCVEIAERFGDDIFYSAMEDLLDRNKKAMGHLIKTMISEEKRYFEDYVCDDGMGMGPYKLACTLWREGDVAIFDFTGTDPQSIGSINFLLNSDMFKMFVGTFMIAVFDPQILFNDGFYDLMEVKIPKGTLLNPVRPAALSCRTHALGRIFDLMGATLGQGAPDLMCAAGFSDSPHFMYSGYDRNGDWYQLYQIGFGGVPGRPAGDGPDGHSMWPAFTNVPNEYIESYFPLRIDVYETISDSGGAGFHRGGNAVRVGYRFLEPGDISIHDDRWLTYPWGVTGGEPGMRSTKILVRAEDGSEEILPSKCDRVQVYENDILYFDTWGGGGWGDPYKRPAEQVALDVARGLVSAEGALRYGVVMKDDVSADEGKTEKLRAKMSKERGDPKLFDFGGTVEELKARCKEETGLEPPKTPVFLNWFTKEARKVQAAE